jgi:hypothetical protein
MRLDRLESAFSAINRDHPDALLVAMARAAVDALFSFALVRQSMNDLELIGIDIQVKLRSHTFSP